MPLYVINIPTRRWL